MKTGVLASFTTPEELLRAVRELRGRGYARLDAFTPYPLRDVEDAIGLGRSPLPWIVLPFGLFGAAAAYFIQYWCNGIDYPLNVGGRPLQSVPAFIPITFETAVLLTSLAGVVTLFVLSKLPELWSPVFDVEGFARASIDRFWIGVDERDEKFDRAALERTLKELGAERVAWAGRQPR